MRGFSEHELATFLKKSHYQRICLKLHKPIQVIINLAKSFLYML